MSGIIETTNLQTANIKHTNGTTAMTVDTSGRVGRPKVVAWKWVVGDAHGSHGGGTAHNPVQWNHRIVDTNGAGGNIIKSGTNHTLVVPVTGIYWVGYGGIKGNSTSDAGRMQMNRTSGSGDSIFPQCRGEENSAYAEMYVSFICNAVAGDEWQIQTVGDGMWMSGTATTANGYNEPFWTGYLIG